MSDTTLREIREQLRAFEDSQLAETAETLARAAESLASTVRELRELRREEWLDADGAATHLGITKKQMERIAPRLPRRYLSERLIRYKKGDLDDALDAAASMDNAVARDPDGDAAHSAYDCDDNSSRARPKSDETGALTAIRKARREG